MRYFDAHCHVQFPLYDEDRADVLTRMDEAQVGGLAVGVDYASSEKAIALVTGKENLWASVGLHPNDTEKEEFDTERLHALAMNPVVVAIGECGLDNYRPEDPGATKEKQRAVFIQHIELALASDKPLMIHARPSKETMDAYHDAIKILSTYKKEYGDRLRGDMHFFVGGVEEARKFIDLDFTLSYTAVLTFARDYDDVVRFAPLSHLLSETDSPYVAPVSRRGQRNDPLSIPEVIGAIASIRGEDEELVRSTILANAQRVFRI